MNVAIVTSSYARHSLNAPNELLAGNVFFFKENIIKTTESVFMQIRCNFPDISYLSETQKNNFQFLNKKRFLISHSYVGTRYILQSRIIIFNTDWQIILSLIEAVLFSLQDFLLSDRKRGMCIKGLIWPPLEPKTENCFSQISFVWFIRRMTEV